MSERRKWLVDLQLFGGEGAAAGGEGTAAAAGDASPDAGEAELLELGVPAEKLQKHRAARARRAARMGTPVQKEDPAQQQQPEAPAQAQDAAAQQESTPTEEETEPPKRMSWDEIMADPEYNKEMQAVIKARLKTANGAEEKLGQLAPVIELLAARHGMDASNLDAEELAKAVLDDNVFYENKAVELGVPVETAKIIERAELDNARRQEEQRQSREEQQVREHLEGLQKQVDALKDRFPNIDLQAELQNPVFFRMTAPGGGVSVEDAYYAVHRKEIQEAAMKAAAENTAKQMANAIRSAQARPVENGTAGQAPSVTTFDYAHATKEQREALKRRIREAAARGEKLYPGQ